MRSTGRSRSKATFEEVADRRLRARRRKADEDELWDEYFEEFENTSELRIDGSYFRHNGSKN